jgi:hypothetical protein
VKEHAGGPGRALLFVLDRVCDGHILVLIRKVPACDKGTDHLLITLVEEFFSLVERFIKVEQVGTDGKNALLSS